jgi:exodeoxyribonuclease-3
MRLVTYNIYMGACYKRGGDRLDQVCQLVRELQPDVLALQECFGPHFSGVPDPARAPGVQRLEAATGLAATVFTATGGAQLLLLCPRAWRLRRTVSYLDENHGVGLAELEAGEAGELAIGAVHLYPWNEGERLANLEWLRSGRKRTILLGDFNGLAPDVYDPSTIARLPEQYRDGPTIRTDMARLLKDSGFHDAAVIADGDRGPTYPTQALPDVDGCPDIRIDFVMVSSDLVGTVRSCTVLRSELAERASDHRPVIATLDLTAASPHA